MKGEVASGVGFERLTRKVRKGELASRHAKVDGSTINIYRAKD